MQIDWHRTLPVIISICVILLVAALRDYSRILAAITATMPINIPLSFWIIWSAAPGDNKALGDYGAATVISLIPTMIFTLVAWQAARAGWKIAPVLLAGYAAWLAGLGLVFGLRWLIKQ